MKPVSRNLLQIDTVVQATLLLPMLVCYLLFALGLATAFYVVAALLQVALAFLQLVSGMAHTILYDNKPRRTYLLASLIYVILLILVFNIVDTNTYPYVWLISVSILPLFIAIWYFWITINDLRSGNFEH